MAPIPYLVLSQRRHVMTIFLLKSHGHVIAQAPKVEGLNAAGLAL